MLTFVSFESLMESQAKIQQELLSIRNEPVITWAEYVQYKAMIYNTFTWNFRANYIFEFSSGVNLVWIWICLMISVRKFQGKVQPISFIWDFNRIAFHYRIVI